MGSVHLCSESHSRTLYLSKESLLFCRHFCPGAQWLSRRSFGICPEIRLSLSRSSLNHFNFCPGGHYDLLFLSRGSQWFTISVQGVTTIYYFCPRDQVDLLFLSRGSLRFAISVQGVTTIYYFCPGDHYDLLFLSRGSFCFSFLSGGYCGPLCMSRGKSSILSSVLVERSSK